MLALIKLRERGQILACRFDPKIKVSVIGDRYLISLRGPLSGAPPPCVRNPLPLSGPSPLFALEPLDRALYIPK